MRSKVLERHEWIHGGVPHRGREGELLVLEAARWRLRDLQLSHALTNYDCTNAFGCTDQQAAAEELACIKYQFGTDDGIHPEHLCDLVQQYEGGLQALLYAGRGA